MICSAYLRHTACSFTVLLSWSCQVACGHFYEAVTVG